MAIAVHHMKSLGRVPSGPSLERSLQDVYQAARAERAGSTLGLREWLEIAEAWRIVVALREARGNRSGAARSLGIGRRTLYSKMKKLGINADWSL